MSENKKPLYQPWNEEEFSSDVFVQSMTFLQRWMYRTLLQKSFFFTTRPYLPTDDSILWRLAGCESRKQWDDNKTEVLERFTTATVDGEPRLENKRVTTDWKKLQDFRESMAARGRAGAPVSRVSTSPAQAQQQPSTSPAAVLLMPGQRQAREVIATENVQVSEAKQSLPEETQEKETVTHSHPQQPSVEGADVPMRALPAPALLGAESKPDFKTFRIRWRSKMGKSVGHGRNLEEGYTKACEQYGSAAVLQMLDEWATPRTIDWAKTIQYPFSAFIKILPKLAERAEEDAEEAAAAEAINQEEATIANLDLIPAATPEQMANVENAIADEVAEETRRREERRKRFAGAVTPTVSEADPQAYIG